MKRAGITVVRVGESTWTSWEPREGEFQFAWMDRIVDTMHAAGIKVVMGTPTYSIPPWLYAKHPEVMVIPLGQVRTPREFYGMRQNMDITHPVYRQYSRAGDPEDRRALREAPGCHRVAGRQRDGRLRHGGAERAGRLQGVAEAEVRHGGRPQQGLGPRLLGPAARQLGQPAAARRHPQPRLEARVGALPALARDRLPRLAGEDPAGVHPSHAVGDPGLPRRDANGRRFAGDLEVPRRGRHQPLPRHAGWARRLVDRVHGRLHPFDEEGALPRDRDERAGDRLGREGPVPAVRRAAAPAGVVPRGERGPHGRLLALALAALRPGDLLEGAPRPRPRAEPRVRGGDADRRRAQAPGSRGGGSRAEEPGGDPAQRRLVLGPRLHADRQRQPGRARAAEGGLPERRGPAPQGALPDERGGRLRVRRGAGLHGLRRAARAAALRGERRSAREDRRRSRRAAATSSSRSRAASPTSGAPSAGRGRRGRCGRRPASPTRSSRRCGSPCP